ncbi:MAG TPA: response regulator transcription factor [Bacteroidia bacterium]|jgi:DNA-binding NarL/FixJ family response regulator
MKKTIKLGIVDDQSLFRQALIFLIKEFKDLEVVIEASSGESLIKQLAFNKPEVVLLDIHMPIMNGLEVAEYLQKNHADIKVLVLSMYNDDATVLQLIERGARGFLSKDSDIKTVVEAVNAVCDNGYYFNDSVSKVMIKELVSNKNIIPIFKEISLSAREIEIIKLICKEYTNKEIAGMLFISTRTVDGHKEKILRKTKAKNSIGIVMYAVKNHLLD